MRRNATSVSWETAASTLAEPQRDQAENLCRLLPIAKRTIAALAHVVTCLTTTTGWQSQQSHQLQTA